MAFSRADQKSPKIIPPELKPEQQRASMAPNVEASSVIESDLSIEGPNITVRCKGCLRVNGNIEANLHCRELLVGEQAVIVGSITANRVAVSGRVKGAVSGDSVILHSSAHVEGDVRSRSLSIEEGAVFDGCSRKVTDPAEVTPQLEPSPDRQ